MESSELSERLAREFHARYSNFQPGDDPSDDDHKAAHERGNGERPPAADSRREFSHIAGAQNLFETSPGWWKEANKEFHDRT